MKSFIARLGSFYAWVIWLVVLGGAGRSFDFTDEGSYYLSAAHPAEVPDRQTTYFLFGRTLFALSGHSIFLNRALIAGLLLVATWVLVRGFRRFVAAVAAPLDPGGWMDAAAMAGTAVAFAIAPLAPSYNLFNAICLLAIAGLVFEAASSLPVETTSPRRSAWVPLLLASFLCAGDFFIKFSTSAVLAAMLALFFLATSRERARNKAFFALGLFSAGLLAVGGCFLLFQNFSTWRQGIAGTVAALGRGNYVSSQLARYGDELQVQIVETLWTYESVFTVLFATGGVLLVLRRCPRTQRWFALAGLVLAGYIGFQAAPSDLARTPGYLGIRFPLTLIGALGLAGGLTWIVRAPHHRVRLSRGSWRVLPALAILGALPLAGAFGTSNNINSNVAYQLAPWLVLIALLLGWLSHSWQARWLPAVGVLGVSVITLGQFGSGYIFNPYRIPGGRMSQTVATALGYPASTVRLDPGSHELVVEVRAQLTRHGFKPGDDIFAFFNLPGLVFALGGVSPGYPWYFSGDDNSLALDAMRANWVPAERRSRAFIILNRRPDAPPPPWQAMYLDFPNRYESCGPALRNPLTGEDVEVWAPRKP